MATDTETLSLPTTTALTEAATSACSMSDDDKSPMRGAWIAGEWDTNMTPASGLPFPPKPDGDSILSSGGGPSSIMMNHSPPPGDNNNNNNNSSNSNNDMLATGKYVAQEDAAAGGSGRPRDDVSALERWLTSDLLLLSSRSVEESCQRSLDHFPCPAVSFPRPALEFNFRIAVALNPEPSRIETCIHKEITAIKGGKWSGSFGNGCVMAGGYDLGQARGFRPIRIVEGAFVLQTTDNPPALLEMRTRGSLSGPCDVLDTLLGACKSKEEIDPRQYGFRTFATVKTVDKRYAELVNCGLWVASGVWRGEGLIVDAYRLT